MTLPLLPCYMLAKKSICLKCIFLFFSPYKFGWTLLENWKLESPFGKSDKDWITFTTYSEYHILPVVDVKLSLKINYGAKNSSFETCFHYF